MTAKKRYGWVIFGLALLVFPNINIVDLFPDFIGYLIIARALSYGVCKAPYFEEARTSFRRLALINALRIPAMLLVNYIRMGNQSDTDIFALVTLVFSIVETVMLCTAIQNLLAAIGYLSERTDLSAAIRPITLFGKPRISAQTVWNLSYCFAGSRALLAFIPEVLLMTQTEDGTNLVIHPLAPYYPIVFIICFSLSLLIGIIWLALTAKYVTAIGKEGLYYSAIDSIVSEERRPELERTLKLRKISAAINTMIVASVFTFEINFDNFGDMNILPRFIFSLILFIGVQRLVGKTGKTRLAAILTAAHGIVSIVTHVLLIVFLESWSYTEIKLIDAAREAYTPIIILSFVESLLLIALLAVVLFTVHGFARENTKTSPDSDNYGTPDRDFHRSLLIKGCIYTGIGILVAISKPILTLLSGGADYLYTGSADGGITTIVTTAAPWFGTVTTLLSFVYIGASVYYLGILKDEVKMKYQ